MELKTVPSPQPTPPDKLFVYQKREEAGYTERVKQFLVRHLPEYFENGLRSLDPNIRLSEEFKGRMRDELNKLAIYTEKDLPMPFWRKWMLKTLTLREYFHLNLPRFEPGKRPYVYITFPYSDVGMHDLPHSDSPQMILDSLFHEVGHYLNAKMGGWDEKKFLGNLSSAEGFATLFASLCLSQCTPEDLAEIVGRGPTPPFSPEYKNPNDYFVPLIALAWLNKNNILDAPTIVDCFLSKDVDIDQVRKNVDGRLGNGAFDLLFPKENVKDAIMNDWEKSFEALVELSRKNNLPLSTAYIAAYNLRSRLPLNEQAMSMLEKEAEKNPTPELYSAIADVYFNLGEEENAQKYYARAIERGSKDPNVYYEMGYLHLSKGYVAGYKERTGFYEKAIAYFTRAIELDTSNHPLFYRMRAGAYAHLASDYPEKRFNAVEDITKEIGLSKHFTEERKAYLFTDRGDQYCEIIASKKFELEHKTEETTKGKLQRELTDLYAKAIADYQRAVYLYPRVEYKEKLEGLKQELSRL
jgi:tetratricopeptide (TPR) repeat protein